MDVGAVFAGYRIERRLGAGGMGAVYLAQHPRLPRKDALKILSDAHADDPQFRARFLREAEIAAQLQHPNLVAVRDRGEHDGQLWIAMQYVDGSDVAELIERGPGGLDIERAAGIVGAAAHGLDEIHRAGLLHRDVKPANILIAEKDGAPDRVLVTDFGIARAADDSTTLAASGATTATLAYASPEQISGDPMDRRGDVYALGCTLFQLLTGSVPFPRDNPGAVMYAHLNEAPPRPSLMRPGVSSAFDAVIAMAMAKNPEDRYSSCGALAAAATRAALVSGDLTDSMSRIGRTRARQRGPLIAAAMLVITMVAVLISTFLLVGADPPATTAAATTTDTARPRSVNTAEWGAYGYIVQAFPELLPPSPLASGYRDIAQCLPMDKDNNVVSFDETTAQGRLFCIGPLDPVRTMAVECNADRSPKYPEHFFAKVEGDERWVRASGSGWVNWGTDIEFDGKIMGQLEVYFDDPGRNFCAVRVHGGTSGTELHDKWWPDAPL
ncbi:serine/threonine-protein kinase [Nocardia sp. NPDC052112]|uniref:serine/threonine-protein kinase n=1 Tax=Nocardia sp. NPDC052112 TaxID=3155646 RepID=UPI00341784C5